MFIDVRLVAKVTGSNPVLTTKIKVMKDKKFIDGFLLGFAITSILWCTLFGYILGQLN